MRRFQLDYGNHRRSKLYGQTLRARRAIVEALPRGACRWRVADQERWNSARTRRAAARAVLHDARGRERTTEYRIRSTADADALGVWLLVGAPAVPTGIPTAALGTRATKLTLRYTQEIQLVFPDWKTLGLYVPRPLKDQIPAGWSTGDRWPMFEGKPAYASEHAWAAANNTGMRDDRNPGQWETDPARLSPFLAEVAEYQKANFARLRIVEFIWNGHAYRRNADAGFTVRVYTGSDQHTTHVHTQFADHEGHVPPWLR